MIKSSVMVQIFSKTVIILKRAAKKSIPLAVSRKVIIVRMILFGLYIQCAMILGRGWKCCSFAVP